MSDRIFSVDPVCPTSGIVDAGEERRRNNTPFLLSTSTRERATQLMKLLLKGNKFLPRAIRRDAVCTYETRKIRSQSARRARAGDRNKRRFFLFFFFDVRDMLGGEKYRRRNRRRHLRRLGPTGVGTIAVTIALSGVSRATVSRFSRALRENFTVGEF